MAEEVDLADKLKEGDTRPEALALVRNLKAALPELEKELQSVNDHWAYEDGLYRFYHQSFKVYNLQDRTLSIVKLLEQVAPAPDPSRARKKFWYYAEKNGVEPPVLHPWFMEVVKSGTGKTFKREDNKNWLEVTRPIVEAFLHAKYFLEMAVKYGKELGDVPRNWMTSGWASILYLYDLR
jgi:hypothetical protein